MCVGVTSWRHSHTDDDDIHRRASDFAPSTGLRHALGVPADLPGGADLLSASALAVELDGLLFHRGKGRVDRAKQNAEVTSGTWMLRFGWQETTESPCDAAASVIALARSLGLVWPTRPCRRRGCRVSAAVTVSPEL